MTSTEQPPQQQAPTLASALAAVAVVAGVYLAAEAVILGAVRVAAAKVLRKPDQLTAVDAQLRVDRDVRATVGRAATRITVELARAVDIAHAAGTLDAARDLHRQGLTAPRMLVSTPETPTIDHPQAVTSVDNTFRDIVNQAMAAETTRNRRDTIQRVLNEFADRNITAFIDRSGRAWSLDAYAEMSVRTAITRAHVDAYIERAKAAGVAFLQISSSATCCPLCMPYDGKIVAIADLPDARAAGLFHPNCKHRVSIIRRDAPPVVRLQPDPKLYQAQQRLRYLERRVRAAKRRLAVALDDQARRKAQRELNAAFAAIRTHIEQTGVQRQRVREQLNGPR